MAKAEFNQENKDVLDSFLLEVMEVDPGKMFGYPAYYVNGKMFACVYEDGVAVKVPEDMVDDLLASEGVSQFRPMDKHTMKQWVLITRENPEEYVKDKEILLKAKDYVLALSKGNKK